MKLKLFLIFFSTTIFSFAQNSDYNFVRFSINEGLSHDNVYAIDQDNKGYLWIGTGDGLNQYDGFKFTKYYHHPNNTNTLASSNFGKILVENDSIIWFGSYGNGLDRYNTYTKTFTHYVTDPYDDKSLIGNSIEFLFKDSQNNIWIATTRGLNKVIYGGNKVSFKHFLNNPNDNTSLSSNRIITLCEDQYQNIWIGTEYGLNKYNPKKNTFKSFFNEQNNLKSMSSNSVQCLAFDNDGNLWIGTSETGIDKFDPKTETFTHYKNIPELNNALKDNNIEFLHKDYLGNMWIGTRENGIYRYDIKNQDVKNFKYEDNNQYSISYNRIEYIFEDKYHILWIGTRGGGLNKLDLKPKKFNNIVYNQSNDNLPYPSIFQLQKDKNQNIWAGTDGGGLVKFNKNFEKLELFNTTNSEILTNRIWSLLIDNEEKIWVGTYKGGLNMLEKVDNNYITHTFINDETDKTSFNGKSALYIYQTKNKKIFVGSENALNEINKQNDKYFFKNYLVGNLVVAIAEDNAGNLWVGTNNGIYVLSSTLVIISEYKYNVADTNSISSNVITSLYFDSNENLWIGTKDGGLNKFDKNTKTFEHFYDTDGLANNAVQAIIEDDYGYLWISTNYGLSKFDTTNKTFKNYQLIHGLASPGFNKNAVLKLNDGQLLFGSLAGITYFYPDKVIDNNIKPQIAITDFKIFNKSILEDTKTQTYNNFIFDKYIELDYTQNVFSIEFAAFDLTNPEYNNYAYIMEDFEKQWNYVENRNYIMYTNLPHGTYQFKVKAANNDEVWNDQYEVITIKINPPFWKTWIFRISVTLIIIISVYLFVKIRVKRVENQKIKLELLVKQRTFEVEQQKEELQAQAEELQAALDEVVSKNTMIESQNENIRASIRYAKTIQNAILPSIKQIQEHFGAFIIYQPKDIVSGDFYWYNQLDNNNIRQYFFAVADCTGHGVPGAFMSMIGTRLLTEIIVEHNILSPKDILTHLNLNLRKALRQDQTDNRDGMDMCFCKIEKDELGNIKLIFTGAKRPLYIYSNNELEKLEADRRTIGGVMPQNMIFFTNQERKMDFGDIMYLTTDGLTDQNDQSRKKYGPTKLLNIIKENVKENLDLQKRIIESDLENYMTGVEQRDDITLLAIKI